MRLRIVIMFLIERYISIRVERNEQSDEEKNSNRTEKRSNSSSLETRYLIWLCTIIEEGVDIVKRGEGRQGKAMRL